MSTTPFNVNTIRIIHNQSPSKRCRLLFHCSSQIRRLHKDTFVHRYNNERYYESLNNLTPADVYFGRGDAILRERKRIKKLTLLARRKEYQREFLSQSFENQNKINSFESARNSN